MVGIVIIQGTYVIKSQYLQVVELIADECSL